MDILKNNKIESLVLDIRRGDVNALFNFFTSDEILDMKGAKYSYFVEKNIYILDKEKKKAHRYNNDAIKRRGNLSDKFIAKEKELLEKYAQKDESGNPVISNGNRYNIPDEAKEEFMAKREAMMKQKQYKEDIEKIEAYNKIMTDYENEMIKLELHRIRACDLPNEISPRIRISLKDFVVE